MPRELAPLALQNKRLLYGLLFRTSAATLLEVAGDSRHLGAEIGSFSVLHTWNQRLQHHPHVHCVIAAGGLAPDHASWSSSRRTFFLPVKVLGRVFRGKFLAGLKTAFRKGEIELHGHLAPLAEPRRFAAWLRVLFRHDWVVHSKRPFGGPEYALRNLGAYTHRVGIANSRLVAFAEVRSASAGETPRMAIKQRVMSLRADEFLRRFLLHLLPRGFVRIRNFGFLANRQRAKLLPLCFSLLRGSAGHRPEPNAASGPRQTPDSSSTVSALQRNHARGRAVLACATAPSFSPTTGEERRMNAQLQRQIHPMSPHGRRSCARSGPNLRNRSGMLVQRPTKSASGAALGRFQSRLCQRAKRQLIRTTTPDPASIEQQPRRKRLPSSRCIRTAPTRPAPMQRSTRGGPDIALRLVGIDGQFHHLAMMATDSCQHLICLRGCKAILAKSVSSGVEQRRS